LLFFSFCSLLLAPSLLLLSYSLFLFLSFVHLYSFTLFFFSSLPDSVSLFFALFESDAFFFLVLAFWDLGSAVAYIM